MHTDCPGCIDWESGRCLISNHPICLIGRKGIFQQTRSRPEQHFGRIPGGTCRSHFHTIFRRVGKGTRSLHVHSHSSVRNSYIYRLKRIIHRFYNIDTVHIYHIAIDNDPIRFILNQSARKRKCQRTVRSTNRIYLNRTRNLRYLFSFRIIDFNSISCQSRIQLIIKSEFKRCTRTIIDIFHSRSRVTA